MKKYETPIVEVTELYEGDVIVTSQGDTPLFDYAW